MTKDSFRLRKVKLDKKGAIVIYAEVGKDEDITIEKRVAPHPDLRKSLNALIDLMAEVFDMPEENAQNFEILGITLSEKKGIDQVLITSSYTTGNGSKTCINSPNIQTTGESYTHQENLSAQTDKIIDETYAFLFSQKHAQLDLEVESQKKDGEDGDLFNQKDGGEENEGE